METPQPVKPKRTLTPEQIEKLKVARQKAAETKRANKELDNFEKNKKRLEREKKREEVIAQIIKEKEEKKKQEKEKLKEEILAEQKQEEIKPIRKAPKPKKEQPPPEPEPEPEEESEEEEEDAPPPPPPKQFIRKTKTIVKKEPTDDELYSKASLQMLKQRLYEQTHRRLASELFNY